ncbi:AraC family transcriptional regulator [Aquabacter spiritensis]|uniref:Helix-turn-helix protein n=1 Tax=Aquabacter spiritensis TaxID=933073 RepID=A0A4R3LPT7_9HYPH|nr:AraC family transcriptional regulator [Aquabacter spiritensis]TCT02201.1 helix-turn-helix protein [Aquabacter spiritensis]
MWDGNPVRLSLLHMLPGVAEERGVALVPLLAQAGLATDERFVGADVVARGQLCSLLRQFARRSGEPTVGLDLAAAANPRQLGAAGWALFSGRTLRECLVALSRQMPDLQGGVALRLEERNGTASWRHSFSDSDREHARVLNEGIAAFMLRAVTRIAGIGSEQAGVHFPHRRQGPARVYEDKLGARVTFGSGDGIALTFDAAWLDRPSLLFDAATPFDPGPRSAAAGLDQGIWRDDAALLAMIHRLVASAAMSGALSLVDTARSLGVSPRTLQRRLSGLDTSFEREVDTWRHAQARLHLTGDTLSIGSVARTLGYGHPSHFIRAFRRWEGRTPRAFRVAIHGELTEAR